MWWDYSKPLQGSRIFMKQPGFNGKLTPKVLLIWAECLVPTCPPPKWWEWSTRGGLLIVSWWFRIKVHRHHQKIHHKPGQKAHDILAWYHVSSQFDWTKIQCQCPFVGRCLFKHHTEKGLEMMVNEQMLCVVKRRNIEVNPVGKSDGYHEGRNLKPTIP